MKQGKSRWRIESVIDQWSCSKRRQGGIRFFLEEAIRNVTPTMQVKAKRRGGSTYQVPVPVEVKQGTALAIRWILTACRQRSGKTMALKLRDELWTLLKNGKRDAKTRRGESNGGGEQSFRKEPVLILATSAPSIGLGFL
jgi:ribosomal protein S7